MGRIMAVMPADEWVSCRGIISDVFGDGPYTYEEAVALNKVQTAALELYSRGHLERLEAAGGEPIHYRRKPQ